MKIGSPSDAVQDEAADDYWLAALRPRLAEVDKFKGHFRRQKALERESEAILKALLALNVHYNTLVPICRFPPEILCQIFSFSAIDEPADSERMRYLSLGWIKVTHVCSYWREAALQEPNLWTNVTYSLGRRWSQRMLARSKTVPISVSCNYRGRIDETLSGNISRIIGLDIDDRDEILRRVAPSWTAPATLLESLVLSTSSCNSCVVQLPADAFGDYAPLLRQVILRHVYLSYDSSVLANLTHLEFTWDRQHAWDPKPTGLRCHRIDYLLGFLFRMPALRALFLVNCLPSPAPGISPSTVSLVQLDTLHLVGSTAQCGDVINNLEFPPLCRIYINLLDRGDPEYVPQGNVLHGLRTHFYGNPTTAFHMPAPIYFLATVNDRHIEAWTHDDVDDNDNQTDHETQYPGRKPVINLQQEAKIHTLEEICDALPFEDLRVLRKENNNLSSWSRQQWLATFGRCNAVEHVLTDQKNVASFSEAFCNLPPIDRHNTASSPGDLYGDQVIFPNLQSLSLDAVNFYRRYSDEGNHRFHYFFSKWLHTRQGFAMALPRLRILRSSIKPYQVEFLKKVVEVTISKAPAHKRDDISRDVCDTSGEEDDDNDNNDGIEKGGE